MVVLKILEYYEFIFTKYENILETNRKNINFKQKFLSCTNSTMFLKNDISKSSPMSFFRHLVRDH